MSRTGRFALAAAVALAAVLALSGCAAPLKVPDATPDMQGAHVVAKDGTGADRTLRMEVDVDSAKQAGIPDAGAGYSVASVRVNAKTVILRTTVDGGLEKATVDDVIAAQFTNVWFTGAVAESYPVQATAGTILILQ